MDASLISDWLDREGSLVLSWWLLVTLAGLGVWPLVYRVMGGLPDRGYTLARAAGLMLTGFVYWFLGSLGLLRNTPGGMVLAWGLVAAAGLVAFVRWKDRPPVGAWLRENALLIAVTEVLFLALLFGWAAYRAHNPEMWSTEKPMEIMFLNGIRHSDTFPPRDPWLSGYSISYYYFGYVIMAMLADLSGVSSGIAFNITIALLFALTGIGALGVVYNLVRWRGEGFRGGSRAAALGAGLLALIFVVLMGNLGTTLVELPYHGYAPGVASRDYFEFWDVEERTAWVDVPDSRLPFEKFGFWGARWEGVSGLGWRYSRVVQDRDLNGAPIGIQPITEFPNFSFVLADIHPHVLGLPFAMLAIGLALNLVLGKRGLDRWMLVLYAIWIGGMIFLNSWDAIYLVLLVGAEALRRLVRGGTGTLSLGDLWKTARFGLGIGGLALVFYLPWLVSFTSQANGVLPNVIFPTPWPQYVLQFGAFIVILGVFLLVELFRAGPRFNWGAGLLTFVVTAGAAVVIALALGILAWQNASIRNAIYSAIGPGLTLRDIAPDVLRRRLIGLPSELILVGMIVVIVGRLFALPPRGADPGAPQPPAISPATGFALLLAGAGAVLTFAPDFVYLHDNFSVRINTVFKLYYQGWIMFSLASAFAVWSVLAGRRDVPTGEAPSTWRWLASLAGRGAFGLVVIVLLAAGLTYPVLAASGRALVDTKRLCDDAAMAAQGRTCPVPAPLTLDGVPTMVSRDEYVAIECLADLVPDRDAVLVEAPCNCGYHPEIGRFSGLTGIPTLMGWGNHQGQWRGDTYPEVTDARYENGQFRDRIIDARELYTTQDWSRAWAVIDRYGIDYIVVGGAERQMITDLAGDDPSRLRDYTQGLQKFEQVFQPVCANSTVAVYRVAPN